MGIRESVKLSDEPDAIAREIERKGVQGVPVREKGNAVERRTAKMRGCARRE